MCRATNESEKLEKNKCPVIGNWLNKWLYMYSIRYYIGIKNDGNKNYVTTQEMLMTMLYEIADLKLHLCYGYSLCLHKYRNRKEMGKNKNGCLLG